MVVGIGEILTFNRKCTIVVGLLFAVIFVAITVVSGQATSLGVDSNPPTVTITSPANLEIDVDIDTNITATFNESMNSSTLNNNTVEVYINEKKISGDTFEDTNGSWNSSNFQGFTLFEELAVWQIPIDDTHRTIFEGYLTYSTQSQLRDYQVYSNEGIEVGWAGNYSVIGWLGDENVVIQDGTGDWIISKLVFEQNSTDTKTLDVGETWDLGDGYSLKLLELDVDGNEAWLALYNLNGEIDNEVCQNQSACVVKADLGGPDYTPIFVTYLNKVNLTQCHIELKYTWLISQDTTEIQNNEQLGYFRVKTYMDRIIIENDEDIILSEGDTIPLFDDYKFEVEDTSTVRYRLVHQAEPPLEGDVSYNSSSNTVTFDPVSNLYENTDYFPLITTGAKDLAGNGLTEDYTWTFRTIDATPPIITDLNTVVTSSTATITWNTIGDPSNSTVKYNESGNLTILEKIDPEYCESHVIHLDFLKANTTYFYFVVNTDQSGNTNESSIQTFTTLTIPRVTIHSPQVITNDSTPLLNATFDRIVASAWYVLDGAAGRGGSNTDNLTVTLPELADGQHSVTVKASDSVGNVGNATQDFLVDTIEPELILKLITEGNVSTLYINSSEPLSNCTVDYKKCNDSSSKNWSRTLEDNGTYLIVGTDLAGNEALRNLTLEIGIISETDKYNRTNYSTGNVTINITTSQHVNKSNITICEYDENPVGSLNATTVSLLGINKFVQIEVDTYLNNSIKNVRIYINYSSADLSEIDEDSLKLYVWNASIKKWEELEPSEIDKDKMIVLGELKHLSLFSILGEEPTEEVVKDDNGGGGGGGGGASGEDFYNIVLSETDRQSVFKNSSVSFIFDLEGNIVKHINFTALNSAGTVAAKVEILNNTSTLVSTPPPHEVFRNLNIWVGKQRGISPMPLLFSQ
jgi:S-layer protein (TIGR01567 family)